MSRSKADKNKPPKSKSGPPKTLRDRQRDLTRTLITESALELFAERGYLQTRVEDIAKAAGTNRTTFYLHFTGKFDVVEALFNDVAVGGVERYRVLDTVLADANRDRRAALKNWLTEWLETWRENFGLYSVLARAAIDDPEAGRAQLAASAQLLAALDHASWNESPDSNDEARDRATMLELMTQRLFYILAAGWLAIPDEVAIGFLTDLWYETFIVPGDATEPHG